MASIIAAMDKSVSLQKGENGHNEFGWSTSDLQEQILQFSFQLTRTQDNSQIQALSARLLQILHQIQPKCKGAEESSAKSLLTILYKLIGQTRDIIEGKGEYTLSYMMIYTWNKVFPFLSKQALDAFFNIPNAPLTHPYGSWKDVKYLCQYCREQSALENNTQIDNNSYHSLILYCVQLVNRQLWKDSTEMETENLSLVAKWIPREGSKYGWLFNLLAKDYFPSYYEKASTQESLKRANTKAKMNYRKIITTLNRRLDTVQIKQCANDWGSINHSHNTSITMMKQRKAFLNLNKNGTQRSIKDDRVYCAENFKNYISESIRSGREVKGQRIGMADFTKQALSRVEHIDQDSVEIDTINSQWRENSKSTKALENFVALVDVSASMSGDPVYAAIALGIRVAEKSKLGKRVLTFETDPTWVNLEKCNTFTEMVKEISNASWGGSTDLYKAFQRLLDVYIQYKIQPIDVYNMTFVIFSDMQINECQSTPFQTLVPNIRKIYADAGNATIGIPYKMPHLVFWNLRSTNGFPSISTEPNVSMVSGFSPVLLNDFCEKGMEAFANYTPWRQLVESLQKERYQPLEDRITEYFQ